MELEPAALDGLHHVIAQHQVLHVVRREDDALVPVEARDLARVVEALDLVGDAAHHLGRAVLSERAAHREALAHRRGGEGRDHRHQLRHRRRVTFHGEVRLLEGEGAVEGEGPRRAEAPEEVALQLHHRLGVHWPAERGAVLDVHQPARARAHPRRHPRRAPEDRVAQHGERQRVHLAHRGPRHLQPQQAATHLVLQLRPGEPVAPRHGLLGPAHVGGPHPRRAVTFRFVARLHQQQPQPVPLEREALLIRGQAQRVLEGARHRRAVEGQQVLLAHQGAQHRRGVGQRGCVEDRRVAEVGAHPEEFAEVGVLLEERLVDLRLSRQHHVALERYRRRSQGLHDHAHRLVLVGEADLPGTQGALERGPHLGLRDERARGDQQEPAVRAVQRAGPQVHEVGGQHALFSLARNDAEQRGRGGVAFLHHRRLLPRRVGDEDVHLEAQEARRVARGLLDEKQQVLLDHRAAEVGEVHDGAGARGVLLLEGPQRPGRHLQARFPPQRQVPVRERRVKVAQPTVALFHEFGDLRQPRVDRLALRGRQPVDGAGEGPTADQRHRLELPLEPAHVEVPRAQLLLESRQLPLLGRVQLGLEGGLRAAVASSAHHPGQLSAHPGHGVVHRAGVAGRQARRQAQG